MRARQCLEARGPCKVTVIVPRGCVEELSRIAEGLLAQHRSRPTDLLPEWRKLSPQRRANGRS
jgi:hypothetical protein